jgi:hypothetical protein
MAFNVKVKEQSSVWDVCSVDGLCRSPVHDSDYSQGDPVSSSSLWVNRSGTETHLDRHTLNSHSQPLLSNHVD